MTTYSDVANLPRPSLEDSPNATAAFNALTDALDPLVIPRYSSTAERNASIPSPASGQFAWLIDSNTLSVYDATLGAWVTYRAASGTGVVFAEDGSDISAVSTTPIAGTPVVGASFVVPPSGNVIVTVSGNFEQTVNGNLAMLSYEIRTGGTVGSGTIVLGADYESRSVVCGRAVNSGAVAVTGGSHSRAVTTLTPGSTYNVRTMHWCTGGTINLRYRSVIVQSI